MKALFKILFLGVLAAAGIFTLSARKSAGKKSSIKQSSTYYYYPRVNMYYDVANSVYIYKAPDGKSWESGKQITDKVTTGMGKKAVLINPPLPVWKSNAHHKMVYSTALYASAKDFRKAPPKAPITTSKPAEDKKVAEEQKTQKKDSGIERFFKRLFKKKSAEEKADKKA